jgi:hypothetical protein
MWDHHRVARANLLAVKYGVAQSKNHVSLIARCIGALRNDYDTSSAPGKAGLPPHAFAFLAPKLCARGVEEGIVKPDGMMSYDDAVNVAREVSTRIGVSRLQTMIFTELAITQYQLAQRGHVTRWDRCAAMGYSAYDAQTAKVKNDLIPRSRMFRAVRDMCTIGIARGLVPPSGAPTRRDTALLLSEALSRQP